MPRRTKILATLGPGSSDAESIRRLIVAGVNVFRLNFSHGSAEEHSQRAHTIRDIGKTLKTPVGILCDMQGPKIRIGSFIDDKKIDLKEGDKFTLDSQLDPEKGDEKAVFIAAELLEDINQSDILLLDDGRLTLQVSVKTQHAVDCIVTQGGVLSSKKGVNKFGGGLSANALTDKDKADIKTAAALNTDYLAISFVRAKEDIEETRRLLNDAGSSAHIIAKIERAEAITEDFLPGIIETADGVMVARGDLGVEIGDAEVPGVQKRLISESRAHNTVVITATQMMQSMVSSPQPTRAEVSDVSNAVLDGTDAVMLSAESAIGRHPVKVVAALDRICLAAERHRSVLVSGHRMESRFDSVEETIAMATMYTANHYNVVGILTLTESGSTAKWMSRISSGIQIFGMTRNEDTERRMALYRGVYPVPFDATQLPRGDVNRAVVAELEARGLVAEGDWLIITKGDFSGVKGGTNSMKIVKVGEVTGERD